MPRLTHDQDAVFVPVQRPGYGTGLPVEPGVYLLTWAMAEPFVEEIVDLHLPISEVA